MAGVSLKSINRRAVLRWLGYSGEDADEKVTALMDECEKKVLAAVNGRYTYRIFDIEENSGDRVTLKGCSLVLTGKSVSEHLKGCTKAALLCGTAGAETDRLIRMEQASDMASAVIADAMAGCAVEAVCDAAEEDIGRSCEGMFMTWRFSPGYGDLPIELQKQFLEVTNAGRAIGVFANENAILTPKKSVTAVIGFSAEKIENKRHSCTVCSIKENCTFRQKGIRCYE